MRACAVCPVPCKSVRSAVPTDAGEADWGRNSAHQSCSPGFVAPLICLATTSNCLSNIQNRWYPALPTLCKTCWEQGDSFKDKPYFSSAVGMEESLHFIYLSFACRSTLQMWFFHEAIELVYSYGVWRGLCLQNVLVFPGYEFSDSV